MTIGTMPIEGAPSQLWWGYKHTSGTYQAKRYFEPLDIQEAQESPFCELVIRPFKASSREHALSIVQEACTKTTKLP